MVTSVTSLGRNGLSDWIIQRLSAVILGIYFVVVLGFFVASPELDFASWRGFMSAMPMKIFTVLALLSLIGHAWVGLWTISTDYLKPVFARLIFQGVVATGLFVYLVWGFQIIWSV